MRKTHTQQGYRVTPACIDAWDLKPIPDFDKLLGKHKRPPFMLGTTQADIDRVIKDTITLSHDVNKEGI